MESKNKLRAYDFLVHSRYLFQKLHPLYISIAEEEKKVYFSLFGKKRKANAVKVAFERALGLAAQPTAEIARGMSDVVDILADKQFVSGLLKLYHLYVEMIESRITVINMFLKDGLTDEVKATNQRLLEKCTEYDNQYNMMLEQTNFYINMSQIMEDMSQQIEGFDQV